MVGKESRNQKPVFGRKHCSMTVWRSLRWVWGRIDQSEASIQQNITGAWQYAIMFCVHHGRSCIPSMKSMDLIVLEKTSREQESAQTEGCKDTLNGEQGQNCAPPVSNWAGYKKGYPVTCILNQDQPVCWCCRSVFVSYFMLFQWDRKGDKHCILQLRHYMYNVKNLYHKLFEIAILDI